MQYIIILFVIFIVEIFLILGISLYENQQLVVTNYKIQSNKIPQEFHHCKIIMLADLHNSCFGKENVRLVEEIKQQHPDYILLAGDMLVGKPGMNYDIPVNLIKKLVMIAPVYSAYGNHEYRLSTYPNIYGNMWKDYCSLLPNSLQWVDNTILHLHRGTSTIALAGLNMDAFLYKRFRHNFMPENYLSEKLGNISNQEYTILLAHNPDYFSDYATWGADLTLSGHIHGGMIRFPLLGGIFSPMISFFPKYSGGCYESNRSKLIVSRGLGGHTFKIRVNNKPELVLIQLEHIDSLE